MEGSAGDTAGRKTRIRVRTLLKLAERAEPHERGLGARLSNLRCQQYPPLPTMASALGQKLRAIKAKAVDVELSAVVGAHDASKS